MSNMLRKYRRAQKEKIPHCCGKEKYVAKGDRA